MSAPERIWAWQWNSRQADSWICSIDPPKHQVVYPFVRADLHDTLRAERDALAARVERLEARDAELTLALGAMVSAVCGHDGFAQCVRQDSGRAYPWPALDAAEKFARAALSTAQEG
jgi:hypothetical protein